MKKVSIIIPVHNSAGYMAKCLDSCVNQTLPEIEVIVVDDCSGDNSPEVIRDYEARYPQTVRGIFLKENIRQGGARNRGIRAAQGEYLLFVDSDDWIELDTCEKLYQATQGADLCGGDFLISTDTEERPVYLQYSSVGGAEMTPAKTKEYLSMNGMFWTRLYRRELLIQNQIFFPEHTFYEDAWFNYMTGLYAKSIVKISGCFYHYYQRPGSTVNSRNSVRQYERIGIAELIFDDALERGLMEEHEEAVVRKYLHMMGANILYTCLGQFDEPDLAQLDRICCSVRQRCPNFRKAKAFDSLPWELKHYLKLTMYSPKLTVWLYQHHWNTVLAYWGKLTRK